VGFFYNKKNNSCDKCPLNCDACDPSRCSSCAKGFVSDSEGNCIPTCLLSQKYSGGLCVNLCADNELWDGGSCNKLVDKCEEGQVFIGSSCVPITCESGQIIVNKICVTLLVLKSDENNGTYIAIGIAVSIIVILVVVCIV
jgi:hypothetical protein